MTEQTQAEKLASEFMAKLTVYAPSKADPIDELHWKEAENWLAQAITQATAELLEEVEGLQREAILQQEHYNERLKSVKYERDQAYTELQHRNETIQNFEAQVAALAKFMPDADREIYWDCPSCGFRHQVTIGARCVNCKLHVWPLPYVDPIQAAVDTYTAKVWQEAIEECVAAIQVTHKETIALAEEYYKINGHTHRCYKYQVDGIDKATIKTKSLLPEPAETEKGGA